MSSKDKISNKRLLAVISLASVAILVVTWAISKQRVNSFLSEKVPKILIPGNSVIDSIKLIAKLIYNAKKHVRGAKTSAYLGLAILEINRLLKRMNVTPDNVYKRTTKEPIILCPEKFKGEGADFPHYTKVFECTPNHQLSNLLSVVKYFKVNNSNFSSEAVYKFLSSASATFPGVRVLLSSNSERLINILKNENPNIQIFFEKYSEGHALNMMISSVKTQYVFVARNLDFFNNDSRLARLIGEIESLNVVLAGGSIRYQNGHWTNGCFQALYRNFTLKYYEGYDESLHECLFCDFIKGPFVSTKTYLVENKFKSLNENNGLYEDWFLHVFQKGDESVVCPDAMFHTLPRSNPNSKWETFMNKWLLNEVVTDEGFIIQHRLYETVPQIGERSQLSSLSKLQIAVDAVKVIMLACLEAGVVCELQEGTELGAVKMGKIIPWDIDFDIRFVSNNCSQCRDLANSFHEKGLTFGDFVKPCCTKRLKLGEINYVGIGYNRYRGDISGHPILDSALLATEGIEPTKILFNGVWMNVPRNPGMSMRNRYGKEIYQHAEHWRYTGGNSSTGYHRMNYVTNTFLTCIIPGAHDCLERYNADGNMQFLYLLP